MRILMLGWEFPPFIAGGLGTACYGLTRALDRLGHEVVFVLPRAVDRSLASHVKLLSPEGPVAVSAPGVAGASDSAILGEEGESRQTEVVERVHRWTSEEFEHAVFHSIPAQFSSPYGAPEGAQEWWESAAGRRAIEEQDELRRTEEVEGGGAPDGQAQAPASAPSSIQPVEIVAPPSGDYGGDLFADAARYARIVLGLSKRERFDVIHAHDWLTYPAGMAVARATGRPLVAHVHATEFDRSGEHVNQRVYDIERRGMHSATRVVCVSEFTKRLCVHRYGVDPARVRVVYNGVEPDGQPGALARIEAKDRIVLFLGRITMQKGPEYFVRAAKRVLEKMDNVKFLIAGSGDMARRTIELAAELGIGHKVLFTGFLRGRDVRRVYEMADLYVMPSVSEPFGIAPLEAMSYDVPVLISRQSGVSEVLTHALKVDFWDVDEMANKIVSVLRRPALGQTLREHGAMEVRSLTWEGAAEKCAQVYESAIGEMRRA